jgi:YD repeat-containing protein
MSGSTYESTISYSYDAGSRPVQIVDSVTGTISLSYDALDRLTLEVSAIYRQYLDTILCGRPEPLLHLGAK